MVKDRESQQSPMHVCTRIKGTRAFDWTLELQACSGAFGLGCGASAGDDEDEDAKEQDRAYITWLGSPAYRV